MSSPIPKVIGKYAIEEKVATGGMGAVFLARDPLLDRRVAIKLLREGFDNPDIRERFEREARSAGRLSHPNIVTIYEFGEFEGRAFIAMEFVAGESLAAIIRRRAPLTLVQKLEMMEGLCAGLAHAHRAGIVHRDIKPSNLILDAAGTLKVLDFGIARTVDSSITQQGEFIGTINYMSPEQIRGSAGIDHRSDVFAVGAVFYELLSYKRAFPGEMADVLFKTLESEPEPLATLCPNLDPAIDEAVRRCLEKAPERRYQDLMVLHRELTRVRQRLELEVLDAPLALAEMAVPPDPDADPSSAVPGADTMAGSPSVVMPAAAVKARPDDTMMFRAPSDEGAGLPPVELVITASRDLRLVNHTVPVSTARFEIGREAGGLRLADPKASRVHAVIEYENGEFSVRDLGSENGTYVNGRQLTAGQAEMLPFGSRIQLGSTALTFTYARDTMLPSLAGCTVAGRYELGERLRESPRGAVYAGVDRNTRARVAVKLLSPELAKYPGYRAYFRREADLAAGLDHPHICSPIDYAADAEVRAEAGPRFRVPMLCYRLMGGGNLSDVLDGGEAIPLERIITWVGVLGDALDHAHARGVIHGDLKPTAIVFDESRTHPHLTDFSVAQRVTDGQGRPVIGAPPYMAPEQWTAAPLMPPVDQFALAVITYYLVTGSRPFEGQDIPVVRDRNFRKGPLAAHEEARRAGRGDVPPALSGVLERAMAPDPSHRFASVTEFARACDNAQHVDVRSIAPRVFISYQRGADTRWVRTLARDLEQQYGIVAYVDLARVDLASRFPEKLEREIQACDVFVCILSETTLQSSWVRREIELAGHYHRPMIPVVDETFKHADQDLQDPAVADFLRFDWLPIYDEYLDEGVARLARLVKNTHASAVRGTTNRARGASGRQP